jgi:hypothetical protein
VGGFCGVLSSLLEEPSRHLAPGQGGDPKKVQFTIIIIMFVNNIKCGGVRGGEMSKNGSVFRGCFAIRFLSVCP